MRAPVAEPRQDLDRDAPSARRCGSRRRPRRRPGAPAARAAPSSSSISSSSVEVERARDVPLARVAGRAERPVVLLAGPHVDHRHLAQPPRQLVDRDLVHVRVPGAGSPGGSRLQPHQPCHLRVELLGRRQLGGRGGRASNPAHLGERGAGQAGDEGRVGSQGQLLGLGELAVVRRHRRYSSTIRPRSYSRKRTTAPCSSARATETRAQPIGEVAGEPPLGVAIAVEDRVGDPDPAVRLGAELGRAAAGAGTGRWRARPTHGRRSGRGSAARERPPARRRGVSARARPTGAIIAAAASSNPSRRRRVRVAGSPSEHLEADARGAAYAASSLRHAAQERPPRPGGGRARARTRARSGRGRARAGPPTRAPAAPSPSTATCTDPARPRPPSPPTPPPSARPAASRRRRGPRPEPRPRAREARPRRSRSPAVRFTGCAARSADSEQTGSGTGRGGHRARARLNRRRDRPPCAGRGRRPARPGAGEVAGQEPLGRPGPQPPDPRQRRAHLLVGGRREPIQVELGPGDAQHVLGLATREPERARARPRWRPPPLAPGKRERVDPALAVALDQSVADREPPSAARPAGR